MKKWIAALVVVFGLTSLTACGSNNDTIVDTKAGKITQKDFYKELKKQAGKNVLQTMVFTKLLSQKYKVTDKDIDQQIDQFKQQNQITSDDQLKMALQMQGVSMSDFRNSMKVQALLFKAQTAGVKVSDKEMQEYFNKNKDNLIEVKASHILVKDKKTADEIEQKIKNGDDFAKLAKQYSTDTGTKDKGGDLGWFNKSKMVKPFADKAFSMKVGQISDPVKTDYGYHIIKLTDRKDTLNDFKKQIETQIKTEKEKPQQDVLNDLIKNGDIKVKDKQFKDLFKVEPTAPSTDQPSGDSSQKNDDNKTDSNK
ncbi:peptidylprolyl isomerase [Camelliibacillus cellulosilyticus]|uniref:Foldase protein PrsA n=1 Tax=Camelliibacillus cellulosilyticus TaxID=2174486 RepID=A0ABV9GPH9_9BACL